MFFLSSSKNEKIVSEEIFSMYPESLKFFEVFSMKLPKIIWTLEGGFFLFFELFLIMSRKACQEKNKNKSINSMFFLRYLKNIFFSFFKVKNRIVSCFNKRKKITKRKIREMKFQIFFLLFYHKKK
jgi:hypothetical protein